jgi:hypothetical protein
MGTGLHQLVADRLTEIGRELCRAAGDRSRPYGERNVLTLLCDYFVESFPRHHRGQTWAAPDAGYHIETVRLYLDRVRRYRGE